MKNFKFVAIIIAIIAPIVKLFPSLALKFTKRGTRFGKEFRLSSKKEIAYLLKHQPSAKWIDERIWQLETCKYMFGLKETHPELFKSFITAIACHTLFDAAYEIVPMDAIQIKGYTIDYVRVLKACHDDIRHLYILADKQPQTFSVAVVKDLRDDVKEAYFSYLFTKCRWEKLMALDVVLFEEAPKNKTAECCLSFIMGLKDYAPRLSAEQLATLGDKFDKWRQTADPFIVADKMAEFWCMKQNFQAILNTLSRVLDTENTQNRNDWARELLKMLAGSDVYASAVTMLLRKGIACPFDFKVLLDKKDSTNVDCNLNLCIYQKLEGRIPENIFELLSPEQQKKLLVARANKGTLTENMLSKVSDATIKNELLDILEEKAQEKWFKPLLNYDIKNEDVAILAHSHIKGKLYPSLLDLTFQDKKWVHVFIEKGWYDTRHLIMLMKSAYVTEIEFFFTHGKMSQPLYEALLTGPNANLAPKAKYYLQIEDNTPAQTKALI